MAEATAIADAAAAAHADAAYKHATDAPAKYPAATATESTKDDISRSQLHSEEDGNAWRHTDHTPSSEVDEEDEVVELEQHAEEMRQMLRAQVEAESAAAAEAEAFAGAEVEVVPVEQTAEELRQILRAKLKTSTRDGDDVVGTMLEVDEEAEAGKCVQIRYPQMSPPSLTLFLLYLL